MPPAGLEFIDAEVREESLASITASFCIIVPFLIYICWILNFVLTN